MGVAERSFVTIHIVSIFFFISFRSNSSSLPLVRMMFSSSFLLGYICATFFHCKCSLYHSLPSRPCPFHLHDFRDSSVDFNNQSLNPLFFLRFQNSSCNSYM